MWHEEAPAEMPSALAKQALLPAPAPVKAPSPPRKEIDLGVALSQIVPASPTSTSEHEDPSLDLSEHGISDWTLDAYIKHANGNFRMINEFIENTNNKFRTLYTMTLADMRQNAYEIDKKHYEAHKSLQSQVDNLNVNSLLDNDREQRGLVQ